MLAKFRALGDALDGKRGGLRATAGAYLGKQQQPFQLFASGRSAVWPLSFPFERVRLC